MTVLPGRYTVFNENGSPFQWGKERVFANVTPLNRVRIMIGDNMSPVITKRIPNNIKTLTDFDGYVLMVCRSALVLHTTHLMMKLRQFQEAHMLILEERRDNYAAMKAGTLTDWRWCEKFQELAELQETCEDLLLKTLSSLQELAPNMVTESFTIVFTKG